MSLRFRIMLLVLLTTFAPSALLVFYLLDNRKANIAEAKQSLNVLAKHVAEDLTGKVSGTVQLLHGLSRAADLDAVDKGVCSAFLGDVLKHYPQYTGLLTIRPDGQLHCDSLRSGRTLDLNDRAYFKQARASALPAFEVVFGRLTRIAVLQVAFPARDGRGELKYVLLASLNLAKVNERYAKIGPHPDMEMVIWDGKGTVMSRFPDDGPKTLAGSSQANSALYRFAGSELSGDTAELPGPDGTLKIWAHSMLPVAAGSELRITLGIPRDTLLAKADRDLREALTILAGGSLLALLGALLFAERGIRGPVARVMTVAERQRAGDPAARIGAPYPHGELGDLMATLDATATSVQSQQVDIERKSQELRRTNRTLRVLSGINTLIVRVRERDELFREACRIAVELGQFRMAWIGVADRSAMKIVPIASAGADAGFVALRKDRLSLREDSPLGNTLSARAVNEKKALVSNDIRHDPKVSFVKETLERGIASMAILPLLVSDEAVGILALYAGEIGFFDEEEMKLLTELAGDIAFAIDHIDKQERLNYLAYYDALTGLANRSLFLERMAQYMRSAVAGGHKLGLFLVDLERFKNVNDSLGRAAGDALLKQVADWLTRSMGDANLLARLGADHFAVVLPRVRRDDDVARLLEKSMDAFLDHPFRLNDTELRIATKVGVALFPNDGTDADDLMRNAEAALKKAKTSGERYLFYTQSMNERVAEKLSLENKLRQALDKKEFVLHYQPKVDLEQRRIVGVEALIRWQSPELGLVPPLRFIPLLEETGLILQVGSWALRRASLDHRHWVEAGLKAPRVAVNVSPIQLRQRDFVTVVEQAIMEGLAPTSIDLEITESLIMEDVQGNIEKLKSVRSLGVHTAIDDFGTGYSSLAYLAKLPVDTLKIDRSFIITMLQDADTMMLVRTMISLAHSLRLTVVAEGVDAEDQAHTLRLLGCDQMQGYLFSKPLPIEQMTKMLADRAVITCAA